MRLCREGGQRLAIAETDSTVIVITGGRNLTYYVDERKVEGTISGGVEVEVKAKWDKDKFKVETKASGNVRITQELLLAGHGTDAHRQRTMEPSGRRGTTEVPPNSDGPLDQRGRGLRRTYGAGPASPRILGHRGIHVPRPPTDRPLCAGHRFVGRVGRPVAEVVAGVDVALIDGSFYSGDEVPGRNIEDIPHPLVPHSMDLLEDVARSESRVIFIHLNNTNPALERGGAAEREIQRRGFEVATEGLRIPL